jgi:hypothetical protein
VNAIPTRNEIALRIRSLIDGRLSRENASAWAFEYVSDDKLDSSDQVAWDVLTTLAGADARSDLDHYLYDRSDFKHWLDQLRLD